jgi:hypothetical protein
MMPERLPVVGRKTTHNPLASDSISVAESVDNAGFNHAVGLSNVGLGLRRIGDGIHRLGEGVILVSAALIINKVLDKVGPKHCSARRFDS